MSNLHRLIVSAALALFEIALSSQVGTWNKANAIETQDVTIRFQATVGEQPFSCERSYLLGTPASSVAFLDFRFYVSDVVLIDTSGNAVPVTLAQDGRWQHETVALLDFENKMGGCTNGTVETNDRIVGTVPAGDYRGLRFTLGVPFDLNHADATLASSPLNLTSLWWNWQFGYKFMRVDLSHQHQSGLVPIHSAAPSPTNNQGHESNLGFPIHLGSTGCEISGAQRPSSCSNPNRATIALSNFEPNRNVVAVDLGALVASTNLSTNQPDTASGCMSEPNDSDCAGIMSVLGIPFNGAPSSNQTFFRLE